MWTKSLKILLKLALSYDTLSNAEFIDLKKLRSALTLLLPTETTCYNCIKSGVAFSKIATFQWKWLQS